MLNSAGDPKPVLPARFTQPLIKPSSITTSTRPCSLWQHRSHPSGPESSGGATQNNDLDWHIDKDEPEGRRSGRFLLPLLSTVFYPHVSCAGGELLVADSPPIENGYQGPLPTFRSVISIPPVVNRLVLFSPGILHRINPFEGERYSVAVNIWEQAPLTTTAAEPPA
jgi:hypothetical protein